MTQEYINKGNVLIAEFLGWEQCPNDKNIWTPNWNCEFSNKVPSTCPITEGLYFNQYWDALMPVVEKIESIRHPEYGWFGVWIGASNGCHIESEHLHKAINCERDINDEFKSYMSDPNAVMETKILSTFVVVVEFIKFWNDINGSNTN